MTAAAAALQGAVFGESCLEEGEGEHVRKANVVAVGKVKVLKLTRETFLDQCGELETLVTTNFKRKVLEGMAIGDVHFFTKLLFEDQELFINSLKEVKYPDKKEIISQGKGNETFYVIKTVSRLL